MPDEIEIARRKRLSQINGYANDREALKAKYGQVWDTNELQRDFMVVGFLAPFVVARRKSDGQMGSLEFSHSPRYYFNLRGLTDGDRLAATGVLLMSKSHH